MFARLSLPGSPRRRSSTSTTSPDPRSPKSRRSARSTTKILSSPSTDSDLFSPTSILSSLLCPIPTPSSSLSTSLFYPPSTPSLKPKTDPAMSTSRSNRSESVFGYKSGGSQFILA
ncbi:hypothetical protein TB2_020989 [Malus domestica]